MLLGTEVDSFSLNRSFTAYSLFSVHYGYLERLFSWFSGGTGDWGLGYFIRSVLEKLHLLILLLKKVKSKMNRDF